MTTIKLIGPNGAEYASIAFEGPPNAVRIYPTHRMDGIESLVNVLTSALVMAVRSFHKDGEEVVIPIPTDYGPTDDGNS